MSFDGSLPPVSLHVPTAFSPFSASFQTAARPHQSAPSGASRLTEIPNNLVDMICQFLTLKNRSTLSRVNKFFLNIELLPFKKEFRSLTKNRTILSVIANTSLKDLKKILFQLYQFNLSLKPLDPQPHQINPIFKDSTLIFQAVQYNCVELVKLLLASRARANIFYYSNLNQRVTLLTHAAIHGQIGIVQALIEARATLKTSVKQEQTALTYLVRTILSPTPPPLYTTYNYKEFVLKRFIHRKERLNEQKQCLQALIMAHEHAPHDARMLNHLLMEAAYANNSDIIEMLLIAKADVNARNACGNRVLAHAAFHGRLAAMETLLKADAEMHSVLIGTARHGQVGALQLLIHAKANVNDKNENGHTALMYGIGFNHKTIVETLLAARADPSIPDLKGYTAHDYANPHPDILRLLKQEALSQSKPNSPKRTHQDTEETASFTSSHRISVRREAPDGAS